MSYADERFESALGSAKALGARDAPKRADYPVGALSPDQAAQASCLRSIQARIDNLTSDLNDYTAGVRSTADFMFGAQPEPENKPITDGAYLTGDGAFSRVYGAIENMERAMKRLSDQVFRLGGV